MEVQFNKYYWVRYIGFLDWEICRFEEWWDGSIRMFYIGSDIPTKIDDIDFSKFEFMKIDPPK